MWMIRFNCVYLHETGWCWISDNPTELTLLLHATTPKLTSFFLSTWFEDRFSIKLLFLPFLSSILFQCWNILYIYIYLACQSQSYFKASSIFLIVLLEIVIVQKLLIRRSLILFLLFFDTCSFFRNIQLERYPISRSNKRSKILRN